MNSSINPSDDFLTMAQGTVNNDGYYESVRRRFLRGTGGDYGGA